MYLEERAKSLVKCGNEQQIIVELRHHLAELNLAFFEKKRRLKGEESFDRRDHAYVHAGALKIYVNAFNKLRKSSNKEGRLSLKKYSQSVLILAERMDLGYKSSIKEIENAQKCYTPLFEQIHELERTGGLVL